MPHAETRQPAWPRSEILRFAGRFLVFFAAVALLGSFLAPAYNRLVAAPAGVLFRIVESPNVTTVRVEKGSLWIDRATEDGPRPFNYFDPYLYFALVPLVSLVLAAPHLSVVRRAKRLALGMGFLFGLHLFYVVGSVELAYVAMGLSTVGQAASRVLDWAQVLLRLFWEAAPLALFVGFAARDWRNWARGDAAERTARPPRKTSPERSLAATQGVTSEGVRP